MSSVVAIHDLSLWSKSSLSVVLPVLEAMNHEVFMLPTMILSTQSDGYPILVKKDLSADIYSFYEQVKEYGYSFDAVYSGYLGNAEIIESVDRIMKEEDALTLVDPVLGDNGELYQGMVEENIASSRKLVEHADISVKQEIERLIEGNTIEKPIHEDITYDDMDSTQDNLWNFLFFTGYLKKISERQEGETIYMEMAIPNSEVRYVYKNAVLRWFEEKTKEKELTPLYESMLSGDTEQMAQILSENLMETISFYDYQESYYHGFLAGMLKNIGNYIVQSNRESGKGRPDILVRYPSVRGKAIIIEIKVSKTYQGLEEKCEEALCQIEEQDYEAALRQEGYQDILKYGVAFYRKECMIKKSE